MAKRSKGRRFAPSLKFWLVGTCLFSASRVVNLALTLINTVRMTRAGENVVVVRLIDAHPASMHLLVQERGRRHSLYKQAASKNVLLLSACQPAVRMNDNNKKTRRNVQFYNETW